MKKIRIFLFLLLTGFLAARGQSSMNCCARASSTEAFASLGALRSFRQAHEIPLPFRLKDPAGSMIRYTTPDGKRVRAYLVRSPFPTRNYLLVFHEWWGLNDYIKQMADRLGRDIGSINVLALDLYGGKVAVTPDSAGKYMQEVTDAGARDIIRGALNYVGSQARIFTIGWCFGGGWSLQAALMGASRTDGCVMYYGMPEADISKLKTLHCDVLGIFANQDGWITPKVVDTFISHMEMAGKKLTVKRYNAVHGFANPSNPRHDQAATEDAYRATLAYFHAHVPPHS